MTLDEFRRGEILPTWLEGARTALVSRWRIVAVVLGGVVLSIFVFVGFWQYQERALKKAQTEFYTLLNEGTEADRPLKVEEFAKRHQGEAVAPAALMWLGSYYKKNGDLTKASEFYRLVAESAKEEPVAFVAIEALAPIMMEIGQADKAAGLHLEASATEGNPDPFSSKLKAATAFETGGQADEALKILEALVQDKEVSEEIKSKAEERILWLTVSASRSGS